MAKKYHDIGSMIERRDKSTGEPVLDVNGKRQYYVKLNDKIELKIDGKRITGFLNISRPRDKFDRMLQNGKITAAEHAQKISRFEKDGDLTYINFEVTATSEE